MTIIKDTECLRVLRPAACRDDDDDAQSGLLGDRGGHVSQMNGTKERASDIPMSTRRLWTAIGTAIDCSMHPTRSAETGKLKDEGVEERAIRLRKLTSAENDCGEIPRTRIYHENKATGIISWSGRSSGRFQNQRFKAD